MLQSFKAYWPQFHGAYPSLRDRNDTHSLFLVAAGNDFFNRLSTAAAFDRTDLRLFDDQLDRSLFDDFFLYTQQCALVDRNAAKYCDVSGTDKGQGQVTGGLGLCEGCDIFR